jgi:hypothetical protein
LSASSLNPGPSAVVLGENVAALHRSTQQAVATVDFR